MRVVGGSDGARDLVDAARARAALGERVGVGAWRWGHRVLEVVGGSALTGAPQCGQAASSAVCGPWQYAQMR